MNINLQIDHLILEDFDLSPSQRIQLQGQIQTELIHLLTAGGLPPSLQNGGSIPKLSASLMLDENLHPVQMGQQIAQSIYQGINQNH